MIRRLAPALAMAAFALAILLTGLLTNWFRYVLSLEAALVVACAAAALLVVCALSYLAYTRDGIRYLQAGVAAMFLSVVIVLYVHHTAIGGLPSLYAGHVEKSPPQVVHTPRGPLKYWIELENPFSAAHAEFLVIVDGNRSRIRIKVFSERPGGYASAASGGDWATMTLLSEDTAILTLGPRLGAKKRFRVDLINKTATELPSGG